MDINKGTLGVVAAIGIVAGASGAMLMTRGGTTAEEPTTETTVALDSTTPDDALAAPARAEAEEAATPAPDTRQPERPRAAVAPGAREVRQTPSARPAPRHSQASAPAPQPRPHRPPRPRRSPSPAIVPAPAPVEQRASESVPAVEEPKYEELVLPAQSVIGIQVDRTVSSETARVEDEVVGRVTREVRVGDRVAIPAGSRATGSVTLVERGGKLKDRARLGVRFTSVVLADGSRVPIETEAIFREGDSPRNESAAKIGVRRHRRCHPRRHSRRGQGRGHRRLDWRGRRLGRRDDRRTQRRRAGLGLARDRPPRESRDGDGRAVIARATGDRRRATGHTGRGGHANEGASSDPAGTPKVFQQSNRVLESPTEVST